MATAGCGCTGDFGNTGYPDAKAFGVVKGKGFMRNVADDGTRNGFDLTSITFGSDLLAAINNPDPSKRLYIFNNINNATAPEADPTFATTDLGERYLTANGITNVLWEQWNVNEQFFNQVQSMCADMGEFEIDVCNNLKGQKEGTVLYGRPINKNSYKAKFTPGTATTPSMVGFNYDYDYTTTDANQWQLPASVFGANLPLDLKGMLDVNLAITVNSATELTIVGTLNYGYANASMAWVGGLTADWSGYSLSSSAAIVIGSVTETAVAGTYTAVITAPITPGAATLTAFRAATAPILNGFESSATAFISV